MFTGIVEEVGKVISSRPGQLTVTAGKVLEGVELGGSIAVNGVCLTVTGFGAGSFTVSIMAETLRRSNLGSLRIGDRVNLERPLTLNKPLGGHLVQGHVDATGRLVSIRAEDNALIPRFAAPPEVMQYIVEKGFIAVDGISLTVISREEDAFEVSIVGFTREHTTLGSRRVGDIVNLEADIIAKYVERLTQAKGKGITVDFLRRQGF